MMKRSGLALCLSAMLALIGPATTEASGKDADEYEHKIYYRPDRGRRLIQRPGPFGKVLDNAGVQTWGAIIPEARSAYQVTGEGETRRALGGKKDSKKSSRKGGKGGKGA
jgi:hypothetical protein